MPDLAQRHQLRNQMRARRRSLSPSQQTRAAHGLACHLSRHLWFKQARHIAFYLPNDGEIDPQPLLQLSLAQGKHCYLPVITAGRRLTFRRFDGQGPLRANRFGIPEPRPGARYRPHWLLDLVLMPLVAYDRAGHRLGMGGGFYDRTFALGAHRPRGLGRRLGLAHSCQEVAMLQHADWDIALHGIATESHLQRVQR